MNQSNLNLKQITTDQCGARIGHRLSESTHDMPYDISERLRAARVQAVEKRKAVLMQSLSNVFAHGHTGTLTAGHGSGHHSNWWSHAGVVGLLLTLVLGLFVINEIQDELGARELADIDAALLTDDLPPAAYIDAGFAQFLKSSNR
ncbi:MAG: DUF3619 family protein [Comamonadaceae bacterium]|nr:DUF3619 family protein [Comamonadaceae bacterium]